MIQTGTPALLSLLLCTAAAPPPPATPIPTGPDEARRLLDDGAYQEAVAAARATLQTLEQADASESLDAATCLEVAAEALRRLGRDEEDQAKELAERAVAIRTQVQGPEHPDTAGALVVLADILRGRREWDAAHELYEKALAIRRRVGGEESLEYATALNGLAGLYYNTGDFAAALRLYRQVLAVREAALPGDHPDLGDALFNLGTASRAMGDLDAAREAYTRAIDISRAAFGPDHLKLAGAFNNLSLTLKSGGDWSGARSAMERALAIYEHNLGPHHAYVAGMLNNLANLSERLGDEDRAIELLRRSLEIREQELGPDHPLVAQTLNNLGDALRRQGRNAEARPLLERSLAIREKALGPGHPHVARTLSSLGELLVDTGDLDGGAALIERGLAIQEAAYGVGHRDNAASLNDLAITELARGRPAAALALAKRAVSILAAAVGGQHPDWAEVASTLARAARLTGDRQLALDMALQSEATARTHLQLTAPLLCETEALSYAALRSRGRDLALQLLEDPAATAAERGRVWEAVAATRGLVLDALQQRSAVVAAAGDPAFAELLEQLDRAARTLAAHLLQPPRGTPEEVRQLLDEDRRRRDAAERALALASAGTGDRLLGRQPSVARIAAALPPRSALVSFVRYRREASTGDAGDAYLAFVLRPGRTDPVVILLGPAGSVDEVVASWFQRVSAPPTADGASTSAALLSYRRAGRALRQAVWDPLRPALQGADLVLTVADGALHRVNFATLPVGRADYLLERGPTFHRLGSERELLRLGEERPRGRGLLALGAARLDTLAASAGAARGPLAGRSFEPLPGAARELEEIAATWMSAPGGSPAEVTLLTGAQASESAFKTQAAGRRAVHVATHAFVGGAPAPAAGSRGVGGLVDSSALPGAMLLEGDRGLAGLLLSPDGTNTEQGEDGVLTALEISRVDLTGVEWTVLSACDTGRGALHASEGVLGLERAFRAAGARTVIVSLWPADDEATRDWMTALYRARLTGGASTAAAVRSAAAILLERRRTALSSHPYAWGAFVAVGDWR